jgi:outer membrane protein TolC
LDDVAGAKAPLTLANAENFEIWDLTLEEVIRHTLNNSQVIRTLGGQISDFGQNIARSTPSVIMSRPDQIPTTFDPAIAESGYGGPTGSPLSGTGVEAALSSFDAQLDSSLAWANNDRPQNFGLASVPDFFAPQFRQDTGRYTLGLSKPTAAGTVFEVRNNINYDQNNNGSRTTPSDWNVNFEATFNQPLLQGAGLQYNQIAGPRNFQQAAQGFADAFDGVLISRIRYDLTLADFERGVRDLMREVEDAYWELYFAYRDLDARKIGRDSALATWQRVKTLQRAGSAGGEANAEAQASSQYYFFRAQVESNFTNLLRVENRLRFLMGLGPSDGRLIRPVDEPTVAQVHFDWSTIHAEALTTRVELRKQRWNIKKRELELIAARNQMLPRLDATGRYRWLGAGDELIDSDRTGVPPFLDDSNAFEVLTGGDYQEWELGLQFTMPLGYRLAMSTVRHHELLLARERAVVQDMELEASHQMADAVRDVDHNYALAQTYFNRRGAADREVEAVETLYQVGQITIDRVLDAQSRQADAESSYYRSLVDYNRAIMRLHYQKGSLLEFNGVYLAEGPWPGKAYFDALRRARQRDASLYLDYGYTRPGTISRGPYPQAIGGQTGGVYRGPVTEGGSGQAIPLEEPGPDAGATPPETIPAPPAGPVTSAMAPPAASHVEFMEPLPAIAPPTAGAASADPVASHGGEAVGAAAMPPNPFLSAAPVPLEAPPVYEPQANHSTVEVAADAASG